MKRSLLAAAALVVGLILALPVPARAYDNRMQDRDYLPRYAYYVLYPIGKAMDDFVLKPIDRAVSHPSVNEWFGVPARPVTPPPSEVRPATAPPVIVEES